MQKELYKIPATSLLEMFKRKETNPVEVSLEIIKNLKNNNKEINAFVEYDEEKIIEQAKESSARWDKKKLMGLLDGIPIGIKDLIITKDYFTRRGSYVESIPTVSDRDAPVVAKIKSHGGVILGKTTTPEFGHKGTTQSNRYGKTLNPWNLNLNAGGSSGGSSAAVAAGFGPLSIGTDGGGSVRIPCSFCGLFGHKPTFGRIPAYPLSPFGTVANIGPISRTVGDSAILMNVITTPHKDDWYSLPPEDIDYTKHNFENIKSLRIGVTKYFGMKNFFNDLNIEEEINLKINESIQVMKNEGLHIIDNIDLDWPHNPADIFNIMWQTGAANLSKKISNEEFSKIDKNFLGFIEKGNSYSVFDLMGAEAKRAENAVYLSHVFEKVDIIIGPTMPVASFDADKNVPEGWDQEDIFSWTPFTYPFNLTKHPASTINCNFTNNNLPVGMQIVAPLYGDKICFKLAAYLEKIFALTDNWPTSIST